MNLCREKRAMEYPYLYIIKFLFYVMFTFEIVVQVNSLASSPMTYNGCCYWNRYIFIVSSSFPPFFFSPLFISPLFSSFPLLLLFFCPLLSVSLSLPLALIHSLSVPRILPLIHLLPPLSLVLVSLTHLFLSLTHSLFHFSHINRFVYVNH